MQMLSRVARLINESSVRTTLQDMRILSSDVPKGFEKFLRRPKGKQSTEKAEEKSDSSQNEKSETESKRDERVTEESKDESDASSQSKGMNSCVMLGPCSCVFFL